MGYGLCMGESVTSFDLAVLLALQEHDTRLVQLRYRSAHLPEDVEIAALATKRAARQTGVVATRSAVADLDKQQASLEEKIHEVDTKITAASKTLYGGTVSSSRELQALEADIASLTKHRTDLEDHELELLIEREPLDAQIAEVDASNAACDAETDALRAKAVEERRRIADDVAETSAARAVVAETVPPSTLAVYEAAKNANRGVGVARLEHGTCMACRLKLSAVDLDRIRMQAPGTVARCDQCGAILVP